MDTLLSVILMWWLICQIYGISGTTLSTNSSTNKPPALITDEPFESTNTTIPTTKHQSDTNATLETVRQVNYTKHVDNVTHAPVDGKGTFDNVSIATNRGWSTFNESQYIFDDSAANSTTFTLLSTGLIHSNVTDSSTNVTTATSLSNISNTNNMSDYNSYHANTTASSSTISFVKINISTADTLQMDSSSTRGLFGTSSVTSMPGVTIKEKDVDSSFITSTPSVTTTPSPSITITATPFITPPKQSTSSTSSSSLSSAVSSSFTTSSTTAPHLTIKQSTPPHKDPHKGVPNSRAYAPHAIHGLIWEDHDYMMRVLIPIACGIGGAVSIVCLIYACRDISREKLLKNVLPRHTRDVSGFSNFDKVSLLADSSDDEV